MINRNDGNEEAVFFPHEPGVVQATSGRVTGVLSKTNRNSPSANGALVYINASPSLQTVLDRVEKAAEKSLHRKRKSLQVISQ